MKLASHIASWVLLLSLVACSKDRTPTRYCFQDSHVYDSITFKVDRAAYPKCQLFDGPHDSYPALRPDRISFNPLNFNQLCYTSLNQQSEFWEVNTFDFCTGTKQVLFTSASEYTPRWSVKGWILFTGIDHQIYKIKSSGDSLTQLTNAGDYNREPVWSPDGTKFCFSQQTGSRSYFFIADQSGRITDTLKGVLPYTQYSITTEAWSKDDKLIVLAQTRPDWVGPGYYDLKTQQLTQLAGLNDTATGIYGGGPTDCCLSPDGKYIYWGNMRVISKLDINSGVNEQIYITPLLHNLYFYSFAVSDNGCLLSICNNIYYTDTCARFYSNYVCLINPAQNSLPKILITN